MIETIHSQCFDPTNAGPLCLIIDAGVEPGLLTHLHERIGILDSHCVPLFAQTTYQSLQTAGPYALLCQGRGALADYACRLLERCDAGCIGFMARDEDFRAAIEHCRRLLTVSTEETPARLLRFYDPRWLEPLLGSLDEAGRDEFLGPFTAFTWRNEIAWRKYIRQSPEPANSVPASPWLHLDAQRMAQITDQRLALLGRALAARYHMFFKEPDPTPIVLGHLKVAQQAGYADPVALERWLRLTLARGEAFWQRADSLELLGNNALPLLEKLDALEKLS